MHAGISGQLLAASLVLIGILLGYFDIRNIGVISWKGMLLLIALLVLLASIIVAALGLKRLRDNGNSGVWDYSLTHCFFRAQTILAMIGLLCFITVFFMNSEQSQQDIELKKLNRNIEALIRIESVSLKIGRRHNQIQESLAREQRVLLQRLLLKQNITVTSSKAKK